MPTPAITRGQRPRGRPADPVRRAARRRQIVEAAFACFSADGYAGTTTAAICRTAGLSSGALFHHFPTKVSILVAVIEDGTTETRAMFATVDATRDPLQALETWLELITAQLVEPRLGGFVRAASAVMGEPSVSAALAADDDATIDGLDSLIARAQSAGLVRTDMAPRRLASWLRVLLDGFLGRVAASSDFDAVAEAVVLRELAWHFLCPERR